MAGRLHRQTPEQVSDEAIKRLASLGTEQKKREGGRKLKRPPLSSGHATRSSGTTFEARLNCNCQTNRGKEYRLHSEGATRKRGVELRPQRREEETMADSRTTEGGGKENGGGEKRTKW